MNEPDLVSQTDEPLTTEEAQTWFDEARADHASRGASFHQITTGEGDHAGSLLCESWKEEPDEYPAPRFQIVAPRAESPASGT